MNRSPFCVFFIQKMQAIEFRNFTESRFFFGYCHSAGWLWYLYSKKKHFHYCLHHVLLLSLTTFPFSLFGGRYLLSVPFMQSIINHAGRSCWILGSLISEALCKKKRTAFLLLMWISLGLKRIWLYSIAGAFWSTLNVHAFLFWAKRMLDSPIFLTFAGDWWTIRDLGKEYICNSS